MYVAEKMSMVKLSRIRLAKVLVGKWKQWLLVETMVTLIFGVNQIINPVSRINATK